MSAWRQLTRGLRALTRRSAADQDLADEVGHFLQESEAAHVSRGLSPDEARRAARREIGNAMIAREQVRSYGWENGVEELGADFRYAVRRLGKQPAFTSVTVLTLALGIGATTAIFSAVNPVLFEALPYPRAEEILVIADHGAGDSIIDVTFGTYRELTDRNRVFDALAVLRPWQPTLTGAAAPDRWDGQRVSAGYFRVLGVSPLIGRDFLPGEDRAGGPRVTILSHALWTERFGGDRGIVGRPVTLDGTAFTVIGVMPAAFENVLSPQAQAWAPLQYDASLPSFDGREWGHNLRLAARLRRGVGIEKARRDLDRIARDRVPEFARPAWASLEKGLSVLPLKDIVTAPVKPALRAVVGAVILLLLIACANVTNLLLARGAGRRGELAVRAALGASRGRLVRQLLMESLVLAVVGGAIGMAVSQAGVRALVMLSPPELPRTGAIHLDGAVFAFALGLTAVVGIVVGLVPALRASRSDLQGGLQESSTRTMGGSRGMHASLVVGEVALALVLLVGAGLLLRSLERLFAVSPGFDSSRLLTMQVQVSGVGLDDAKRYRFLSRALEAVRNVPGVDSAAFTSQLPLSGDLDEYGVHPESGGSESPDGDGSALRYAVSQGYIETMQIPLRRGRVLDEHDTAAAPKAVLVSESFAKRVFPGQDPLGRRIQFGPDRSWDTIVGVVGEVKQTSLALNRADAVYVPSPQWTWIDSRVSLVVRARGDAAALASAVRRAVWSIDKDQPVVRVATMEALLAASAAERRFALILFEAFAIVALVLAAAGIYGVLSGSVAERTREMGVRAALGATRRDLLAMVLAEGMRLTGLGVAIGVLTAAFGTRALVGMLFDVSPLDPGTYVGVIALLVGVAILACAVPARRAARADPAGSLRSE